MAARETPGWSTGVCGTGWFCALLAAGCGGSGSANGTSRSATVAIAPALATIPLGGSTQFVATLRDSLGNAHDGRPVTWSSADTTIAVVDSAGAVSGAGVGATTVTAAIEGMRGQAGVSVLAQAPTSVTLVGAGDIADCDTDGDEQTAALLDTIAGTVFTTGDNAYSSGSTSDFAQCYDASCGRHKARTRPAPGNHDYRSASGGPYFSYFGALAGDSRTGYYSYDLGAWHVIALNSNIDMRVGSHQEQWLRADLGATTARCVLAYWHHPRFSSGTKHGSQPKTAPLWKALHDFGADLALAGHEHHYERFAPQNPSGGADPDRGIRLFVVGTGGAKPYPFGAPLANSEVRYNDSWGVLRLTLWPDAYGWQFIAVGGRVRDSGSGHCH
ncbi:MAG TPA: Ig-like domain-containing protein [Gemmatimonadales bacterium]